jgi:hypothetical protein
LGTIVEVFDGAYEIEIVDSAVKGQ